jgi:1-acyl-sn-glycerol-3-phosphate acyltransferase
MTRLRSLLFNICFFTWTILLILAGVPMLYRDRHAIRRLGMAWASGTLWLLRWIVGARFEVRGARLEGPMLVAAKHQSALDTMIFYLLAADPVYVMKNELHAIPIFGRLARHQKMIIVDRKAGAAAMKQLLTEATRARDDGRQIVIFPQGTRTAPGATLAEAPYQPGIAGLYHALKVPVTPIALNSGLVWGRRSFMKQPGKIVVELLPEIPVGLPRAAFMRELERVIEAATIRLEAEAGLAPRPAEPPAPPAG